MKTIAFVVAVFALAYVPNAVADVAHVSTISPTTGSNEGGTPVIVTGHGFQDTTDLKCKWTRANPESEQVTEKTTPAKFVSSNQVVCDSPHWNEARCPYCDGLCEASCANNAPHHNTESHANVLLDNGHDHWTATTNHHLGMGGAKGQYPDPTAANEYHHRNNPLGQYPLGWKNTQAGHQPHGQQASTMFHGYTGSRYLRTDNKYTNMEIGVGNFIKIAAQYFKVMAIEPCEDNEVGCWCDGKWSEMRLTTNNTNTDISAYPVGEDPLSKNNSALWAYDKNCINSRFSGSIPCTVTPQCQPYSSVPSSLSSLTNPDGSQAPFPNTGNWKGGSKITLSEAIYKKPGTQNVEIYTNEVYISSKKSNVDCKGGSGCALTLTVTNDGKAFSGAGTNGKIWQGSGATFHAKFVVPVVKYIEFENMEGTRDSTRMFVPASGQTAIIVHGEDFQPGPLLRCYFDTVRQMVPAEFISSTKIRCQVPSFVARRQDHVVDDDPATDNKCADTQANTQFANDFIVATSSSRAFDTECTDSQQNGAGLLRIRTSGTEAQADYSYSHVQVTNTGKYKDLSEKRPRSNDGSYAYIQDEGSDYRSTCHQLEYPIQYDDSAVRPGHEQDFPCHGAHISGFDQGNDVQVKYASCYEAMKSGYDSLMDYRQSSASGSVIVNATMSLGQKFRIPKSQAGPLVAMDLHLNKLKPTASASACGDTDDCAEADRRPTRLELCISAGGFKGHGHTLACEQFSVQNIKSGSESYVVYFRKQLYLLSHYTPASTFGYSNGPDFDATYYATLEYVSGPATVSWALSDQTSNLALSGTNAYYVDQTTNASTPVATNVGFRATPYTCDGCRKTYISTQSQDKISYQVGKITGRQNQSETYLRTHPSVNCRSTASQPLGRSHWNRDIPTHEGLPRANTAKDPTGVYGDECGTPTYREQMAQAVRPLEDITVTKLYTTLSGAYSDPNTATHDDRTVSGDFKSADGSTASVWITEHGKMGEYVCQTFTGTTQTSANGWANSYSGNGHPTNAAAFGAAASGSDVMLGCGENNKDCMHCDTNNDGSYDELCFVGALCNKSLPEVWGGCGVHGVCAMSEVVSNGHYLRNYPDGSGPFTSRCGEDVDCHDSQSVKVQHSLHVPQATSASAASEVVWEFKTPVTLNKHTTYYVNMAIDESIARSDSLYWWAGNNTAAPAGAGRTPFLGSYTRTNIVVDGQMRFTWVKNPNGIKFDLALERCVTSLPQIASISTSGEAPGTCAARASPRGGDFGPKIYVKGKNFFPSGDLMIVFLYPNGQMGPSAQCKSTKYDFTEMECESVQFNPFAEIDCTVPDSCQGVHVMASGDGINFGPQHLSPKYIEPYEDCTSTRSPTGGCHAVPVSINGSHHHDDHFVQLLGTNTLRFCFSNIYVSPSGNDFSGDGSQNRPFQTIQRAISAANEQDVIVLLAGTYSGVGNTALQPQGKQLEIVTQETDPDTSNCWCANGVPCSDHTCMAPKSYARGTGISHRDNTIIDCENSGALVSGNAGQINLADITTRNCELSHVHF